MTQLLLSLRCNHVLLQSIIWSLCSNYHGLLAAFFVAFCCSFIGIFESTCFFSLLSPLGILLQSSVRLFDAGIIEIFEAIIVWTFYRSYHRALRCSHHGILAAVILWTFTCSNHWELQSS